MEETLRKAAQESGVSILQLSKRGNIAYMSCHSFIRGTRTLTLPVAGRLAEVLGLALLPVAKKKAR